MGTQGFSAASTLGVFLQIPFCASKCTFCNFSSKVESDSVLAGYLASLEHEIELLRSAARSARSLPRPFRTDLLALPVDTVYLGGGTPTLAGRDGLTRIFMAARGTFRFETNPEVTLEMTPGSADAGLLATCRDLGIDRLSIGAQSFHDAELRSVGRLHTAVETVDQIHLARAAGFGNINLDLIAGLPHQTEASWLHSVQKVLDLAPEHVSIYLFEVDEKSRLGNEVLIHGTRYHAETVPSDDFMADAYERARDLLCHAGYVHYEISNFARPGFESRHNRKYWRLDPYLGLGAGAHSFDGLARWSNEVSTAKYANRLAQGQLPIRDWHLLDERGQLEEFFFLGLRQREGVELQRAVSRWGPVYLDSLLPRIDSMVDEGLLERQGDRVRLTPRAYLISNEVFKEFVAEQACCRST